VPSAIAKISPHINQLRSLTTDVSTRVGTSICITQQ